MHLHHLKKFNGDVFTHFHALPHTISCNVMQFGLFQPFLANFNMLGMKMHVLKERNSMMILSNNFHTFSCNFHAISGNFSYFSHFWDNFNMLSIKMYVLELRNSMVILSHTSFMHIHAFFLQFFTILAF